jgi:hypothetical protein
MPIKIQNHCIQLLIISYNWSILNRCWTDIGGDIICSTWILCIRCLNNVALKKHRLNKEIKGVSSSKIETSPCQQLTRLCLPENFSTHRTLLPPFYPPILCSVLYLSDWSWGCHACGAKQSKPPLLRQRLCISRQQKVPNSSPWTSYLKHNRREYLCSILTVFRNAE